MNIYLKLLTGAAAVAAFAVPAAAQSNYPYYPQQSYPQQTFPQQSYPQPGHAYPQQGYAYPQQGYPQQGYQQGGIAGIINQLLGNRHNGTDRSAVTQCATAAQAQATAQYRPRPTPYGNAYGQYQGAPYGNAYGYHAMNSARVTAITNVEQRRTGLRVSGLMNSGMANAYSHQGYGNQAHHPAYANAGSDLSFRCNVDHRGVITNVRVGRLAAHHR